MRAATSPTGVDWATFWITTKRSYDGMGGNRSSYDRNKKGLYGSWTDAGFGALKTMSLGGWTLKWGRAGHEATARTSDRTRLTTRESGVGSLGRRRVSITYTGGPTKARRETTAGRG